MTPTFNFRQHTIRSTIKDSHYPSCSSERIWSKETPWFLSPFWLSNINWFGRVNFIAWIPKALRTKRSPSTTSNTSSWATRTGKESWFIMASACRDCLRGQVMMPSRSPPSTTILGIRLLLRSKGELRWMADSPASPAMGYARQTIYATVCGRLEL